MDILEKIGFEKQKNIWKLKNTKKLRSIFNISKSVIILPDITKDYELYLHHKNDKFNIISTFHSETIYYDNADIQDIIAFLRGEINVDALFHNHNDIDKCFYDLLDGEQILHPFMNKKQEDYQGKTNNNIHILDSPSLIYDKYEEKKHALYKNIIAC